MTRPGWVAAPLILLALAGCVRPERRAVELPQTYDRPDLLRELRCRAETVITLKAKLNIHFETPELDGPQSCDGLLRYQAPDQVRLRGDRDFVGQVFDLVSDGERYAYWFIDAEARVPKEVYLGSVHGLAEHTGRGLASLALNFGELLGLLCLPEDTADTKVLVATYPDHWLIDLVSIEEGELGLLRRWWVDRVSLACRRIEIFGEDGELVMEVELDDHDVVGPGLAPLAHQVRFDWPGSGEALTFELSDIQVNEPLKPALFEVTVPEGAEPVHLD